MRCKKNKIIFNFTEKKYNLFRKDQSKCSLLEIHLILVHTPGNDFLNLLKCDVYIGTLNMKEM